MAATKPREVQMTSQNTERKSQKDLVAEEEKKRQESMQGGVWAPFRPLIVVVVFVLGALFLAASFLDTFSQQPEQDAGAADSSDTPPVTAQPEPQDPCARFDDDLVVTNHEFVSVDIPDGCVLYFEKELAHGRENAAALIGLKAIGPGNRPIGKWCHGQAATEQAEQLCGKAGQSHDNGYFNPGPLSKHAEEIHTIKFISLEQKEVHLRVFFTTL